MFDQRHLVLRGETAPAVLKTRSAVMKAFRDFFDSKGFIEVTPPCMVQTQAEGGSTLFELNYYGEKVYVYMCIYIYTCIIVIKFHFFFKKKINNNKLNVCVYTHTHIYIFRLILLNPRNYILRHAFHLLVTFIVFRNHIEQRNLTLEDIYQSELVF